MSARQVAPSNTGTASETVAAPVGNWACIALRNKSLGEHAQAWDALRRRLFRPNPMLDSRFVDAMLQHFGQGVERLCIYRRNGRDEAMCVLRPRGVGVWTTFLPSQAQIGPLMVERPDTLPDLLRTLPGVLNGQLDLLCNDPDFGDLLAHAHPQASFQEQALTINIDLSGSFEDYWAGRSKKLVQNIGRYERRAINDGLTLRFTPITSPEQLPAAVRRYAELESKGWKGAAGTALAPNNQQGVFYGELISRFAESGQALIYELWMDDTLAASRLVVADGNTLVFLKTTYAEDLEKYAPGRIMLRKVIEHAFATFQGGCIEFYTNANADQLSWATSQRRIRHVSVYRSRRVQRFFDGMRMLRQIMASRAAATGDSMADRTLEVHPHPDVLPAEVHRLFAMAEKESMDLGHTWYSNLVDTVFPHDKGVEIHVLRQQDQPLAALPVRSESRLLGRRVHSLGNYYSALYAPVLAPKAGAPELAQILAAIRNTKPPLSSLRLEPMQHDSEAYSQLLEACKIAGLVPFQFFCFGNWYLPVDKSWSAYLAERPGALRNSIRRHGKKFAAAGGTLELVDSAEALDRGLDAYQKVYGASWKDAEPFPAFVPQLAKRCAERGWLRLGLAHVAGTPIAAQLWIVVNGKASIYKLAHDEHYQHLAPGTLLTAMLMEHVMQNDGVSEVDYLIGDDPYKSTWMTHRRERWGIVAYNPSSLRGFVGLAREIAGRAFKAWRSP